MPYYKNPETNIIVESTTPPIIISGVTYEVDGKQIPEKRVDAFVKEGFNVVMKHTNQTPFPEMTKKEYDEDHLQRAMGTDGGSGSGA